MRMKPKTLAGLIILFLFLAMIPPVSGNGWPEEQTRHIIVHPPETGTDGDMFVTEAGLGFSTSLVTVLDPNMDIYGYLFFKDIKLNSYFHLENATLRLHTASTLDFDNESAFTIYGIADYRYFGMGEWGYGSPAQIMSAPLTSAHVNYNSSQFYGSQWWEIDVTNIVQELKSNPWYEGPGLSYYDPGDYMAFIILGAGGYDSRWFYDVSAGNGFEAQLHIHWDFSPPPPSGYEEAEYVEDYGNHTIWRELGGLGYPLEPMEYVFTEGTSAPYDVMYDNITVPDTPISIETSDHDIGTESSTQRGIVRMSNGTIFVVYDDDTPDFQVYIKQSADNGTTWTNETRISTYAGMENNWQYPSAIAVDSSDNLHVVWAGQATGFTSGYQIWYALYDGSWHTPVRISTYANMATQYQSWPVIAVDSIDGIHVVWQGMASGFTVGNEIWYCKFTTDWSEPVRISTYLDMNLYHMVKASIAINSQNHIHVAFAGKADGFTTDDQIWYALYDDSWHTPVRISTYANMATETQYRCSLTVDSDDNIHIVWDGHVDFTVNNQIFYANYTYSWETPIIISNYTGMNLYSQIHPSIAVDPEDYLHVLWEGMAYELTDFNKIWYANYTDSWAIPDCLQPTGRNRRPNLRWSRWPVPTNDTYIVVDANGTVLVDDLDSLEDAEDWIDGYDPDPEDPDPAGEWSTGPGGETGAFTRFRMRLWFLIIGFGCLFGPILFFAWRRPSGYYLMAGSIVMLIGLGLLMSIAQV